MKNLFPCRALAAALGSLLISIQPVLAQGTAFTYQGQLSASGSPANGNYDFTFALFNNSSTNTGQVGSTLTDLDVGVTNGLFTVTLDFGANFPGASRWLAIGVRTNGSGSFTALSPLQQLTPTPYAIYTSNAGSATTATAATAVVATSFSGALAGDVTGPQGATVVASVGGQTAANVSAGVIAANGATTNIPGTIVKRDSSGNFSAGSVTLNGTLTLPNTPATIFSGQGLLLYSDTNENFFVGPGAGNLTLLPAALYNTGIGAAALANDTTGGNNTAVGFEALYDNTTGGENTAVGYQALVHNTNNTGANTAIGYISLFNNTSGNNNTACGTETMGNNISGSFNAAFGQSALAGNMTGSTNTASGAFALAENTIGSCNTASGYAALFYNTNGNNNTACGYESLVFNTSGGFNTACGDGALFDNTSGSYNIALGHEAGSNLTTGSYNIDIGNPGNAGEANTIRIGTPGIQTQTFLTGNVAIGASATTYPLEVQDSQAVGRFVSTSANFGSVIELRNNTATGLSALGGINFNNAANTFPGQILYYTNDSMTFSTAGALRLTITNGGLMVIGTVSTTSDRNAKENFQPVDAMQALEKVAALPITRWNFKQDADSEHIGPMAQDFYAAFKVGPDDKHITTVDEGGVALAAIQGLNQKLEAETKARDAEIQGLKKELAEQKNINQRIEERFSALEKAVARLANQSGTTLAVNDDIKEKQ